MTLPEFFYRVFDDESVSQYDQDDGFCASRKAFYPNRHWAKFVVERHMDWGNRCSSPFISVTSSYDKALTYLAQREQMGRNAWIAKVDVQILEQEGVRFWHMQTLAKRVGAYIEPVAWNESEWLCLHQIPAQAVVEIVQ
jgi:hypothetical protein